MKKKDRSRLSKPGEREPPSLPEFYLTQILRPFQRFAEEEASGGIILLLCTVAALVWSNSPWQESYAALWHTEFSLGWGHFLFSKPLHFWINDGLMTVFFLLVGLEIKRELLVGELASPRRAALPIVAALGGMVVPAAIYFALNAGTSGARGWGIPMATDIAFAIGVLALLGRRVPAALKVFLVALAIVDDIGAVLVIAIFYTSEISWISLAAGLFLLLILAGANRSHLRHPYIYAVLGIFLWLAFLKSGVHTTIAGVLLAMTIPARTRIGADGLLRQGRALLDAFEEAGDQGKSIMVHAERQDALQSLEEVCEHAETPLQRFERALHPWVTFLIMPLFALANAGVTLEGSAASAMSRVSVGIVLGLVLGKQIGITFFAWAAVRFGMAALPPEIRWRQIYGVGWLGGIGFTMSLFVADLAFGETAQLPMAKMGILAASILAGAGGWIILYQNATRKNAT